MERWNEMDTGRSISLYSLLSIAHVYPFIITILSFFFSAFVLLIEFYEATFFYLLDVTFSL